MRIYQSLSDSVDRLTSAAIAIGNFDGVHLGHQALFAEARRSSETVAALTFEPHPARLLAPEYAPPLICSRPRKLELLEEQGVAVTIEQRFDREFMTTGPDEFVAMLLRTGVRDVIVGHDFTYGRGRGGTVTSLGAALASARRKLHIVPPVAVNGLVCSSTKVREFVLEGRVEAANMLLGRPFDLDGVVVRGAGRGRKLGYPTANIRTTNELLPAVGVYAVRALALPDRKPIPGAANLGLNPTFNPQTALAGAAGMPPLSLEVFLFDFDRDVYDRQLRVEFVHRLREERRFRGVDELKAQIASDVERARELLAR